MSALCQRTKSLRSSPLRGSKSREAGSRSRGQRWRGGKVNTISSCIVGVQRMIKNSKDYLAGRHPDAASHIDPARRSRAHACAARHQHAASKFDGLLK
jgi:hypothetical protein